MYIYIYIYKLYQNTILEFAFTERLKKYFDWIFVDSNMTIYYSEEKKRKKN